MRTLAPLLAVVVLAGCPAATSSLRLSGTRTVVKDAAYVDDGDDKHRLDLYAPESAEGVPIVVFVHGGTWQSGDRDYYRVVTGLYGNVGHALAAEGIATAVPSYRLWPDASMDAMLDDVAAAIVWAHAHAREAGADPGKLFVAGHSAGGHLVTLLATKPGALAARGVDPTWIRGVVSLSGALDMERARKVTKDQGVIALWPTAEDARAASPLRYLSSSPLPFLLLIGGRDYPGLRQDFRAARALRLHNVESAEVPNLHHSDMVLHIGAERDPITPRVARFVRSVVGR